jgi:hypothetical protein
MSYRHKKFYCPDMSCLTKMSSPSPQQSPLHPHMSFFMILVPITLLYGIHPSPLPPQPLIKHPPTALPLPLLSLQDQGLHQPIQKLNVIGGFDQFSPHHSSKQLSQTLLPQIRLTLLTDQVLPPPPYQVSLPPFPHHLHLRLVGWLPIV